MRDPHGRCMCDTVASSFHLSCPAQEWCLQQGVSYKVLAAHRELTAHAGAGLRVYLGTQVVLWWDASDREPPPIGR